MGVINLALNRTYPQLTEYTECEVRTLVPHHVHLKLAVGAGVVVAVLALVRPDV